MCLVNTGQLVLTDWFSKGLGVGSLTGFVNEGL